LRKKIGFRIGERRYVNGSDVLKRHFAGVAAACYQKTGNIWRGKEGDFTRDWLPRPSPCRCTCGGMRGRLIVGVCRARATARAAWRSCWAAVPFPAIFPCSHKRKSHHHDLAGPADA
jgi:hypothetical protein